MDPRQLAYFRTVARHEHMGRAAAELGISDSTLSRSMARLEQHYGGELFDRVGRGLRLNAFGRALLGHVERALSELENGERELRTMRNSGEALIALGFLGSLGVHYIPDLIAHFMRQRPDAHFRLTQASSTALRDLLLRGDIDLAFVTYRFPDPAIAWQPLWDEELIALVPPMHRFAKRARVDLAEIALEPVLTLKSGNTMRRGLEELARNAGFAPNVVFESDEISTVVGLAGAGFGIALVPESVSRVRGAAVPVRLRSAHWRTIGVASIKDRYELPAVTAFRELALRRSARRAAPSPS
jgi:DNA-binding transcriptional LysR family regulator